MTRLSPQSNSAFFPALVAVLSHELGSPLAAIKGAATTLIDYRQRLPDEWVEVVSPEGIVLPTDPVLMSLQTIVGLAEGLHELLADAGRVRLVARPGAVSLDRVAQQYARVTTGIGADQLWAALRQ